MKAIEMSLQENRGQQEREVALDVDMNDDKQLKIKTPSTGIFTENNNSVMSEDSLWLADADLDV